MKKCIGIILLLIGTSASANEIQKEIFAGSMVDRDFSACYSSVAQIVQNLEKLKKANPHIVESFNVEPIVWMGPRTGEYFEYDCLPIVTVKSSVEVKLQSVRRAQATSPSILGTIFQAIGERAVVLKTIN